MNRKNKEKNIKLCFAASSGGHYEQLLMLKPLMDKYNSFILTEKTTYLSEVKGIKTYYIKQVNRKEKMRVFNLLFNAFISLYIFLKEKPDVIICTGVLAMIPMCLICKLFQRKLIYIESFAKVTSATETGKLMYRLADQFYIQWESMLEVFPKAIYIGGIY